MVKLAKGCGEGLSKESLEFWPCLHCYLLRKATLIAWHPAGGSPILEECSSLLGLQWSGSFSRSPQGARDTLDEVRPVLFTTCPGQSRCCQASVVKGYERHKLRASSLLLIVLCSLNSASRTLQPHLYLSLIQSLTQRILIEHLLWVGQALF